MSKMTLEKLSNQDTQSLDIRAENIAKLKALFPEILSEKGIDFSVLKQLLGEEIEEAEERYSFTWNGKAQARRLAQTPSTGTLRPCKEESKDWDSTQNLFIEGDNLEVLKLLQKSYHQRIKMIYIDPPYNTGTDFVYPDNYRDNIKNYLERTSQSNEQGKSWSGNPETSGRYHTDWLNMMYPRLKLARNLLRNDGVIFISIDDREVRNLKTICDEIFGEENALVPIIWSLPRGINAGHVSRAHEYVLVYAKDKVKFPNFNRINEQEFSVERCNKKIDARHPASEITFPSGIRYEGKDQVLTGDISGSERISIKGEMVFKGGVLAKDVTLVAGWTMKNMILDWLSGKPVVDTKGQKIVDFFFKENGKFYSVKELEVQSIKSIPRDMPDTQIARKEIELLFGSEDYFDYPKPVDLIKYFIDLTTSEDDVVLDCFAGSCPTAQAVFSSNLDNQSRKFILVQIGEPFENGSIQKEAGFPTIADFGKERIRRAGSKLLAENAANPVMINMDFGFKVFKLDSSNIKPWDADFDTLSEDLLSANEVIKPERSQEDVLFEILLKYGLDLNLPVNAHILAGKTVFEVGAGALLVCLDKDVTESVAEAIGQLKAKLTPAVCRVVFRDAGFADDAAKVNAVQVLKQFGIDDVKSL